MAVEVLGVDAVQGALDALAVRLVDAGRVIVNTVLQRTARQERTMLSLGWHPPGTVTGSIAPAPPWRISGDLSRSVRADGPHKGRGFTWWGRVGPTSIYARIQELGGVTGRGHRTHLPSRPHLRPAWAIVRPSIRAVAVGAARDAIKP